MVKIAKMIVPAALLFFAACQEEAPAVTPLADPSGLKVEQTGLTTVELTWADNAQGETGYRVFLRGEDDPYTVSPLTVLAADAVNFEFETLEPGRLYDFGVQALSENMKLHSKVVYHLDYKVLDREGLAGVEGGSKLAAPSDLSVIQRDNTSVTLSWTDNASGENGYNLYFREASAESFGDVVATVEADVVEYTFTGLQEGASYVFAVQTAGADVMNDSRFASIEYTLKDVMKTPSVMSVKTSHAYVAVSYKAMP